MTLTKAYILQLNVEGLTQPKRDIINHLATVHNANIILLQETHQENVKKLVIEGFTLTHFIPTKVLGIATYIKEGIKANLVDSSIPTSDIQWNYIQTGEMQIINLYKPPPSEITNQSYQNFNIPASSDVILTLEAPNGVMETLTTMVNF
jgi:exonuclease III